jgi:hypothetical protein
MPLRGSASLFVVTGCVAGLDSMQPPPVDPPQQQPVALYGVMDSPRHGQVDPESTDTATLQFHGYASRPGEVVSLQALEAPNDPNSWRELAKVSAAVAPIELAAGEQMYEWQATLAPSSIVATAWPQGGLLRVRAQFADQSELTVFADDANACLAQAMSWKDRSAACGYHVANGAIIVSPGSLVPLIGSTAPRGLFLDRIGQGSVTETEAYYTATGAPATFTDFKTKFGFGAATEASAAYYNRSDLAVGRDMHCVQLSVGADAGLACYSSNYGAFSGPHDDALSKALVGYQSGTSAGAFATVAMVYTPPITAPNAVSFVVYNGAGARIDTAQLDRFGDNVSIPQNCMNCHGGASTYDFTAHAASNARFLPFDPAALDFSTQPGFTFADQAARFQALNDMVRQAAPAPVVDDLLAGFYSTGAMNVDYVPDAWMGSVEDQTMYRQVIAPYCRGCHQTYAGTDPSLGLAAASDLRRNANQVASEVCGTRVVGDTHGMPNAEVVSERFLSGSARAYLADATGATGACVYGQ